MMSNPLLNFNTLPLFEQIDIAHISPAIEQILSDNKKQLESLLNLPLEQIEWNNFFAVLEQMDDCLQRAWSPISHLHGVKDSEDLRQAYTQNLEKITLYQTELEQNEALFQKVDGFKQSQAFSQLKPAQQKIINNLLRDFKLAGVALSSDKKQQFKQLKQELAQLKSRFEQNLLDATQAWFYQVKAEDELKGLPDTSIAMAADLAKQRELEGWVFNLDFPSFYAVMTYADNRQLREAVYSAYVTRASDQGPNAGQWDNSQLMVDILQKRQALASLLGFRNYADYSLATKMAETTSQVLEFLENLVAQSKDIAKADIAELKEFTESGFQFSDLQPWDYGYYSEKLRQQKYAVSAQEIKEYFPEQHVLKGMFEVVKRLYGMEIKQLEGVQVWHPDVRFYEIFDGQGQLRGQFYLDLYARQHKRGGAWMDECLIRRQHQGVLQLPVAYLTCNLTPPVDDLPALFTHDEVITIFHEFGHGLHHMLTQVDYSGVSGINGVTWDAVELPSQFFENWCWEPQSLALLGRHYKTGEEIPSDLIEKMRAARNFQSAMQMLRQLEFALFDFRLHMQSVIASPGQIQELLDDVRQQVAVIIPPAFNRFQHGFSHIFAGGYAAGYYSYKWAEVLAADAFDRFLQEGIFNPQTGQDFLQSVLEQGGVRDAIELFKQFRGREPEVQALLKQSGILKAE